MERQETKKGKVNRVYVTLNKEKMDELTDKVCDLTGIPVGMIRSFTHIDAISLARFKCMYIAVKCGYGTKKEISKYYGMYPSALANAMVVVENQYATNPVFRKKLIFLVNKICPFIMIDLEAIKIIN